LSFDSQRLILILCILDVVYYMCTKYHDKIIRIEKVVFNWAV